MSSLGSALRLLRAGASALRSGPQKTFYRRAGGGPHIVPQYRQYPQVTKNQKLQAEILSSTMWFWMLWHFWHSSDDVLGHFAWPDASQWTDEELGIPADDEE
ncbi:NADH dehydrogenase [ubiquinone] 1 beta subcomplex subunit 2, mitochondrial [Gadus chalcogrammus]|uniref:NADH dehydrogenase [ubiquinone] 1 beta subcomplex subunit 2, mitochondrial n=1 Tax=Gadus chalcogrammus TaxID=1042646 RepID=UPI0024C4A521|nr:NADH dehydrogenase [ubiquinone] 1 beta subcomplex subunit 2, mitochondrial [Gadus chalcogrammus]